MPSKGLIHRLRESIRKGNERIKQIRLLNARRRKTLKRLLHEREAITMYDSVTVSEIPAWAEAVLGYIDGLYVTMSALIERFPHAFHVGLAVFAKDDAEGLDIESGDARPEEAPDWVKRQHARGLKRPVLYASVSNMDYIVELLSRAGIRRREVRLLSAHDGKGKHICSPHSCGETKHEMDGTQYEFAGSYDVSILHRDFFHA